MERLKVEAENHQSAHNTALATIKDLEAQLVAKEREIATLNNKVSLLSADVDRAEKRADDVGGLVEGEGGK